MRKREREREREDREPEAKVLIYSSTAACSYPGAPMLFMCGYCP